MEALLTRSPFSSVMSQATREEIAAENAMYDRLTLAVTEALTTLPTKDLQSWNLRAGLFTQVDKIINDVLESGKGRPQIGRFYLCLLLYRIVSRLLDPIDKKDCGQTDGAVVRQAMARMEQAAKPNTDPVAADPSKPPSIYNRRRSELSEDQLERVQRMARERQARWRAQNKRADAKSS
jgi:hypothetical protein